MSDIDFTAHVSGLQDLGAKLRSIPPKLRSRVILNALRAGARAFRDEARRLAPVLSVPVRRRNQVREVGTLKRAISVRTSKIARRGGDLGVFVNVRPAKGAQRGNRTGKDPFYWRWLEFDHLSGTGRRSKKVAVRRRQGGRRRIPGKAFLRGALTKGREALARIEKAMSSGIQKLGLDR